MNKCTEYVINSYVKYVDNMSTSHHCSISSLKLPYLLEYKNKNNALYLQQIH